MTQYTEVRIHPHTPSLKTHQYSTKWPRTRVWRCVQPESSVQRHWPVLWASQQCQYLCPQHLCYSARLTEEGGGGGGGEEERISTKQCQFGRFQVSYLKHSNGIYKWLQQKRAHSRMLPSYLFLLVTHLQRILSRFTHNTLIKVAILNPGHSYIPTYQRGW